MHLLPAFFTTTSTSRKSKGKPKTQKQIEHEKWLQSQGLSREQLSRKKVVDPNWKTKYTDTLKVDSKTKYESAGMSGSRDFAAKRGIMEAIHKEPEHVRREILIKASRCMPLYNKGGIQYASPAEDMTQIGSKSRRG
jgi:hypothetical protein